MGVPGDPYDALYVPLLDHALRGRTLDFFDAHTHLGQNDPDGRKATPEEIVAGLDRGGQRRALIFAMEEPGGYPGPNDAAIAAARTYPDRLVALARIDPQHGRGGRHRGRARSRGRRRRLQVPSAQRLLRPAASHRRAGGLHRPRAPGAGPVPRRSRVRRLGLEVAALSRRYPGARLILAHAGISDLGLIGPIAAESPNVFFDTSWWLVSDLLMLYTTVPPGRILYASDMPYGSARLAAVNFLRCAAEVALGDDALALIAGAQLDRVIAGEDPIDAGPAPGMGILGGRDLVAERGIAYLASAMQIMIRGGDATEALALGRLALKPAGTEVVAYADRLVEQAQAAFAARPEMTVSPDFDSVRDAVTPVMAAQMLLGTPKAGAPV